MALIVIGILIGSFLFVFFVDKCFFQVNRTTSQMEEKHDEHA